MGDTIDGLRMAPAQYLRILESVAAFLIVIDRGGMCTYVTSRTAECLDPPGGVVVGTPYLEILPEASRPIWRDAVRSVLDAGRTTEFRDRFWNTDFIAQPLAEPDGRITHAVVRSKGAVRRTVTIDPVARLYGENETVLRAVVDNSPAAINLKDLDGRFLLVNAEFERWHGRGGMEMDGRTVHDIYDPAIADRLTQIDRMVAQTRRPYAFELDIPTVDGRVVTAWVQKFPVCDDRGQPIAIGAVATDITVRKDMEQSLRDSEARFRAVYEESAIGMATVSPEGRYLSANQAFCAMLGYAEDEIIGMSFAELTHPDDQEYGMAHHRRYQAGESVPTVLEKRYIRKDGSIVWATVAVSSVRDAEGREVFGVRQVQNISDRKETENWMRTLSLAIEQYPGGVWITDPNYRFEYVNPAYRRETGFSLGDLVGETPALIDSEGADSPRQTAIAEHMARRETWRGEVQNRRKDGSTYLAAVQVHPIVDAEDRVLHFVGFSEDVTEQREIAERLRQSEKMEVVGQLTGGVAHDFNNILAVILTNAEILEEAYDRSDQRRLPVAAISRAALRAAKLTERLLAFSRRQALHPERINLCAVVGDMVDILRRTLGETITVETDFDADAPWVSVDVGQMENAILNLAVNARDAMPNGGRLRIGVGVETAEIEGGAVRSLVRLTVADSGCGMSEAIRARIFEPFFTTKARGMGTGLGLSMVYGFVTQSGGSIRVESAVGEGTVFHLMLPALSASEIEVDAGRRDAGDAPPDTVPPISILLVEDDPAVRAAGRYMLESMGARVVEAHDAQSGLEALAAARGVDLLFTDVVMPGGFDGRWLAEKAQMLMPGLRVLFTSGYAEGRIDGADFDARSTGFVAKPFTRRQLTQAIRALFEG